MTLAPSLQQLEFHSLTDGSLIKTIDVDFQSDAAKVQYFVTRDMLTFRLPKRNRWENRHYSTVTGKEFSSPFNDDYRWLQLSPGGKLGLWHSHVEASVVLIDAVTLETKCRWTTGDERYEFLNDEMLLSFDSDWGLTIREHDLDSGDSVIEWQPYRWVFWLSLPCICLSTIWLWKWLRLPKPNSHWTWFDLLFVFAALMLLICVRLLSIGAPGETLRHSYPFAMALSAGMLLVATCELFLAGSPLLTRVTHLLFVAAVIFASLASTLGHVVEQAIYGLMIILTPALLSILPFAAVAILRSRRRAVRPSQPATLQQLFWLTSAFALVFLSGSGLLPGIGGAVRWMEINTSTVLVTIAGPIGLAFAAAGRVLRRLGTVLAAGCYAALAIPALYSCIRPFWDLYAQDHIAPLVICGCAFYLVSFVAMRVLHRDQSLRLETQPLLETKL